MSEKLIGGAFIAVCAMIYAGIGAMFANIAGATSLAWWTMVVGWPVVLVVLAVVIIGASAVGYFVLAMLASAVR